MKCTKCGKEFEGRFCPECGTPAGQGPASSPVVVANAIPDKPKMSGLGIAALILCIIGCTFWLGVILAIIDLVKKDGKKKTCSIIALVISALWILLAIAVPSTQKSASKETKADEVELTEQDGEEAEVEAEDLQEEEEQQAPEAEVQEEEKAEFYPGETAEQKDVKITLVSVTESLGGAYIKPADGNIFLLCEFEIENDSEKDISISSVINFEAYCDDYSLNQDIMGLQAPEAEGKGQLDGNVAAGKKMNGVIAYQVPSDYKTMEINVSPDFWLSNNIKFVYSK